MKKLKELKSLVMKRLELDRLLLVKSQKDYVLNVMVWICLAVEWLKLVLLPVFDGRDGHPVFFRTGLREQLLALTGDAGGRSLIRELGDAVVRVPVEDEGVALDLDAILETSND